LPDQLEPFESAALRPEFDEESLKAIRERVLTHESLAKTLANKHYIWIGASLREGKGEEKQETSTIAVLYNYTDNLAIEVTLDAGRNVLTIKQLREQPAPVREEIDQAIELARGDDRLARHLTHDMVGSAILVSPVDPLAPDFNHRQFDVRFGHPTERVPHLTALVDLSTRTVLAAGQITGRDRCDHGGKEE
jgi:hypothetical protein